ncbi:carboxymuconolactone decarboxylase family protein [Streptomyces sp. NPDC056190]|uniref:carboxymuconolactone decarboxylase family protein n=1 Tax=Streptomyces sp. NPDC056190 TaxID=3345741 RepID=UPI0035DB8039
MVLLRLPLPDARLDALSTFTAAFVQSRGLPTAAQIDAFLAAGYTEKDILQILLALSAKTISNYTNHLFHTPVDKAFAHRTWQE